MEKRRDERRNTMELTEIGRVENRYSSPAAHYEIRKEESLIVIYDEYTEGLHRINEFKRIQVIFGHHPPEAYALKCLTDCGEIRGVFATHLPMRPSSLDSSTVTLLGIEGNILRVQGINAANGSPVYDLKPFAQMFHDDVGEQERIERLKENPRIDFIQAVCNDDRARCLVKTAEIHGHYCPGSALGVMASLSGLGRLGMESLSSDGLENLMAVVEVNACFADGVQAVSGCTLGNNSLVYRDLGRHAVTFAVRGRDVGIRVKVRPDFRETIARAAPEFYPLMEKVIKNREGDAEDEAAFKRQGRKAAFALIELPYEELLITEAVRPDLPDYAPITESIFCPVCGEMIMATKVMDTEGGRNICLMCAGGEYRQVEGRGIV
jgi:formylmethanofuran dehydrogenase subunit E